MLEQMTSQEIRAFVQGRLKADVAPREIKESSHSIWPRISVVMPSFNQAAYIERSLLSVLNQNYPKIELIVIDGGSTDGTQDILAQYSEEIAHLVSEPDSGQANALNKGFARATGDIFAWLTSDDLYLPGTLEFVASAFRARPGTTIVYGGWFKIGPGDDIIDREFAVPFSYYQAITEGLVCQPERAMFWRREVQERVGPFDERLQFAMDNDFLLRIARLTSKRERYCTPKAVGCFRLHPDQKTVPANANKATAENLLIFKEANLMWRFRPWGRALAAIYRTRRAAYYIRHGGLRFFLRRLRGRWRMDSVGGAPG